MWVALAHAPEPLEFRILEQDRQRFRLALGMAYRFDTQPDLGPQSELSAPVPEEGGWHPTSAGRPDGGAGRRDMP